MMTTTIEKYRLLAARMYKQTEQKKLPWRFDIVHNRVEANVGAYTLGITESSNRNGEPLYIVEAMKSGNTIERFDDEDIAGGGVPGTTFQTYFALCAALFDAAKRQATGVDIALDELLDELDDELPF